VFLTSALPNISDVVMFQQEISGTTFDVFFPLNAFISIQRLAEIVKL
jgi:hypothetical protein